MYFSKIYEFTFMLSLSLRVLKICLNSYKNNKNDLKFATLSRFAKCLLKIFTFKLINYALWFPS